MRHPDRAGWSTPIGSVVVIRAAGQLVIGVKPVTVEEATEYRDALTAALDWLSAVTLLDTLDDGGVPEPCPDERCRLNDGHKGTHRIYAHASDDPWAVTPNPFPAADQLWGGED